MGDIETLLNDLEYNNFLIGRLIDLQQYERAKDIAVESLKLLQKAKEDIATYRIEMSAGLNLLQDMTSDLIYLHKHGKKDTQA